MANSYPVTVRRERQFATHGDCWVARDAQGDWRAWGAARFAETAAEAVRAIFHADEIVSVKDCGEYAEAVIAGG